MGLMLGSLRKIWPWKAIPRRAAGRRAVAVSELNVLPGGLSPEVMAVIALAITGFLAVIVLERLAGGHFKQNQTGTSAPGRTLSTAKGLPHHGHDNRADQRSDHRRLQRPA